MKALPLLLALSATASAEPGELSVSLGAGLAQFTETDMRRLAKEGASWTARLAYRTESFLSIEGSYVGSLYSIDAPGLPLHAYLLGTGVDVDVRVGMRYEPGIEPYFFAGFGWTQYRLTRSTDNMSTVPDVDNIGTIPLGLGVSFHRGRAIVDLRALHHSTMWVDVLDGAIDNGLDSWSFTLGVGLER